MGNEVNWLSQLCHPFYFDIIQEKKHDHQRVEDTIWGGKMDVSVQQGKVMLKLKLI